jgi:SAM-dependent methyltransferase
MSLTDPEFLTREFATSERLERRRHQATGWRRGDDPWDVALRAIAEARPRRVLDAGCGDGLFACSIAAPVVVGIDSSPGMVERALSRGVDARVADLHELPFADGEFDVVVCAGVLHHLHDLDRAVAEIARVLRPGGRLVAIENCLRDMDELWSVVAPDSGHDDHDYREVLGRHLAEVECRDTEAYTLWETASDLQEYLDTFADMLGPLTAPGAPYPFKATRRSRIYVAEASRG